MALSQTSTTLTAVGSHLHVTDARCPWCDQTIPHEKLNQIRARIEAKERERSAEVERHIKEQVVREKALARAEVEAIQKQAAAALEKEKLEATKKEAAAREEARKAAEAAMAKKLAESERAKKATEQQLLAVKAAQEKQLAKGLKEQREVLEKASTEAVNAERAKAFKDKLKLEGKLQEMQRQLQQKTAEELGEGAELDLFEVLKGEFRHDRFRRVNKGVAGADIVQEVMNNGKVCGCIIYDVKNRNAWRNEYVTKLRQDQLAAKADHAVLATAVFPAGARQLHIQDGVIVVNPARAIVLVEMLRKHLLQTHGLRLSNQARSQKTVHLYEFMTSDRCSQLLEQMNVVSDDLLELDVKEKKAHDITWKRRGELMRTAQRAHGDFSSEIERIVGATDSDGGQ